MIGFISAGVAIIAFLVVRRLNVKKDLDQEPMLQDDKNVYDLEQDMADASSEGGTVTTLSAGAVGHLQISNKKTIVPYGNVGEAEIGEEIDSREGAEPLSLIVDEANLFDSSVQGQDEESNTAPMPHFCDSPLCERCCGTVSTPQYAGCCMISPSCPFYSADMEKRPYTSIDTVDL